MLVRWDFKRRGQSFLALLGSWFGVGGRHPVARAARDGVRPLTSLKTLWARQTRHHSAATFSTQPELAEAARLLDLSEHRLGQLLARAIGAGMTAGLDFHGDDARAAALSFPCVLGPSRRDIGVDLTFLHRRKVWRRSNPASADSRVGLLPRLASIASTIGGS